MNRFIISVVCAVSALISAAEALSPQMEQAVTICSRLSSAIYARHTGALKSALHEFRDAKIRNFNDLRLASGRDIPVDGHFVFDEVFVDSLIVNREILSFSGRYADLRSKRATGGPRAGVKLTTRALAAGAVATWKTAGHNLTEVALVAEPGGLFTVTVLDSAGNVLYSETEKNKQGKDVRRISFSLPDKYTKFFIEVRNTGTTDASFALIAN